MSVWFCIPSARPPEEADKVLKLWRERGYKIALYLDTGSAIVADEVLIALSGYPGYARAVNALVHHVMNHHVDADWFVTGGDDTEPDPNKTAEEIASECSVHFLHASGNRVGGETFGVMQPTGDRWHEGVGGFPDAPIDRVCGSPWMGREFCRRIYSGNGPIWPEFEHMYEDEHLQQVALKLGILWQRRDLTHRHNHWGRGTTDRQVIEAKIPPHLVKWNERRHWTEAKAIYERLKAGGFAEALDLLP